VAEQLSAFAAHFPAFESVIQYGSGSGNALLMQRQRSGSGSDRGSEAPVVLFSLLQQWQWQRKKQW
jgi:hypothetical protein